ncbi:Septin spn4 [Entomophthora muscae]|uniref:Septin spn4 n=1 Tax=Entomophthora muscae TaxID=34485 RepID=A0ACC2U5D9_9FUNG|nr:Septin spn4 [Entomophthora muscae]
MMSTNPSALCGIANLPNQLHKIAIKKGIPYTILVVGESGLGKTTFVNTLLSSSLLKHRDQTKRHRLIEKTTQITLTKAELEEDLFKVKLNLVDTPGFGDFINNNDSWISILNFIEAQYQSYFFQEQQPDRAAINDMRISVCLYFIRPTGHGLSQLDIKAMKAIGARVNLVPVIAKADTLSPYALEEFKNRIRESITANRIEIFKCPVDRADPIDNQIGSEINEAIPFAIVGSDKVVINKDGKEVLGREYSWGVVEVENDEHCDFRKLRNLLIRTNMLDLVTSTDEVHYDVFKKEVIQKGIGELRKKRENPKFKEEEEALRFKFTEQVRIEESRFRQWELKLIAERDRLNKDLESEHMTVRHLESEIESLAMNSQTTKSYRK